MTEPVGVDRQVGGVGEIGMGGPNFWTVLLADGAMPQGVCGAVRDLPGPLRIALTQSRQGLRLQVYDVAAQVIHTLDPAPGQPTPEDLEDLAVRSPAKAADLVRAACRRATETVSLVSIRGLRLPEGSFQDPAPVLTRRLPSGRQLEAHCLLPADLRGTAEVDQLLAAPPYALWMDGAPTGLHVGDLDEVLEPASGSVILRGRRLNASGRVTDGLWLAWRDGRWKALAGQAYEPLVGRGIRTPYFLSEPKDETDGRVSFAARAFRWSSEGEQPGEPLPSRVELAVSWRDIPLELSPKDGRITLTIPDA